MMRLVCLKSEPNLHSVVQGIRISQVQNRACTHFFDKKSVINFSIKINETPISLVKLR